MGFFDKKICDICGEKIGLLGNRKLEDGNMCKDCARKLSPFFTGRKKSTVAEIKEQLVYREKNRVALSSFTPSATLGEYEKVYFDFQKGTFVVSGRSPSRWDEENPDVVALSAVYSCNCRIDEDTEELYTENSQGEEVSYNPPRYKTTYDFYIVIGVNHPYFDEMELKLNDTEVEGLGSMDYNRYVQLSQQIISNFPCGGAINSGYTNSQPYAQPVQQPQPGGNYYQPQPAYAPQPNMYAQPNGYASQTPYVQQNQYEQPNFYSQQPVQTQGWTCRSCNSVNSAGNFCAFCGAPKG